MLGIMFHFGTWWQYPSVRREEAAGFMNCNWKTGLSYGNFQNFRRKLKSHSCTCLVQQKQYCAQRANCGMLEKQMKNTVNSVMYCDKGLFPVLSH
jgi:hypothetical protein